MQTTQASERRGLGAVVDSRSCLCSLPEERFQQRIRCFKMGQRHKGGFFLPLSLKRNYLKSPLASRLTSQMLFLNDDKKGGEILFNPKTPYFPRRHQYAALTSFATENKIQEQLFYLIPLPFVSMNCSMLAPSEKSKDCFPR